MCKEMLSITASNYSRRKCQVSVETQRKVSSETYMPCIQTDAVWGDYYGEKGNSKTIHGLPGEANKNQSPNTFCFTFSLHSLILNPGP